MPRWEDTIYVNGLPVEAFFSSATVEDVVEPLLDVFDEIQEYKDSRTLVFLAAPPGTGKSTFGAFLEALYAQEGRPHGLQCLGLDGFHHTNAYLSAHALADGTPLIDRKGCPESFDVEALMTKLDELGSGAELTWPRYDRTTHEPQADGIQVTADIIVLEGNWLLLDEEPWADLTDYADLTVMLGATELFVKERLISRKTQGGSTRAEAKAWFDQSDGKNVKRVLEHSKKADIGLQVIADGEIIFEGEDIYRRFM